MHLVTCPYNVSLSCESVIELTEFSRLPYPKVRSLILEITFDTLLIQSQPIELHAGMSAFVSFDKFFTSSRLLKNEQSF